jgi:arylformamidase
MWTARISEGASVNLSAIAGSPHVGTHADAPWHVDEHGARSETLPLEAFVGRAWLSDVTLLSGALTVTQLQLPASGTVERLLLRTDRTVATGDFPEIWPCLSEECVADLVRRGLRLLAVDCPSVDHRDSKTLPVHHAVFGSGAYVLENLDLRAVPAGWHDLVASPLRIVGLDAAPTRAFIVSHK